jgi:competence protein ComEC
MGAAWAWLVGTALQLQQEALWTALIYGAVGLGAIALGLLEMIRNRNRRPARWKERWMGAFIWAMVLGLVAFSLTGLRAVAFDSERLNPALEGQDLRITGVVAELPQRNAAGLRFRLRVESARLGSGVPVAFPKRMDVGWYNGMAPAGADASAWELQYQPQPVRPGERWELTVRVKAPHGSSNPHGFDYELWLWEQGVQATGYVRAGAKEVRPHRVAQTWLYPVARLRQALRERIELQVLNPQAAGMIAALVIGDQGAIDRADWDIFRATGVAHLVSISGLHITMFAWLAMMCVGALWRHSSRLCHLLPAPSAALLGGLLLATAYALFSGWGVPAQRTCAMLATVVLLRLMGARWPWTSVWMLACVLVVALDPWALLQAGFWLSFVAVGVLFASDSRSFDRQALSPGQGSAAAAARYGLGFVREQGRITLALAPLSVVLFGQLSLVGLLANVLAVPWVTLVLTPLAMLGVLVPALWSVAAWGIDLMMLVLQAMAAWPGAVWMFAVPPWWLAFASGVGSLLLVLPLPWSFRVLGLPLVLGLVVWRPLVPALGEFEIVAADVGQGNAVVVRTATHALLYDAGPRYSVESDAGNRVLVPLLSATHTQLQRMVLSHRDADHVGGAAAVLALQSDADVWSSLDAAHPLLAKAKSVRCQAGQSWVWDGVVFEVLHPTAADYASVPALKSNALSCVLRVQGVTQSALLVGDIERVQEAQLLSRGLAPATFLLVPHHGSKTSSTAEFLAAVLPSVAVVQAGYRNRYGHPASEVRDRYLALEGVRWVDTANCGAFTWQSWLPQHGTCQREQTRRYWSWKGQGS